MRVIQYGSCSIPSFPCSFSRQPGALSSRYMRGPGRAPTTGVYCTAPLPSLFFKARTRTSWSHGSNFTWKRVGVVKSNLSNSDAKRANLAARKKERIELPKPDGIGGDNKSLHISEFLSHKSGIEAMLNKRALQSFESIDSNMYRCTLPQVQLLNFEVAPVLILQVNPTSEGCTVELLSCKFEGSDLVEQQNDHFAASMINRITWETVGSQPFLNVDVKLNISLEIYTLPFTMLPASAVESPGNIMMQALVDRLVPLLLQQLLQDYDNWVQQHQKSVS